MNDCRLILISLVCLALGARAADSQPPVLVATNPPPVRESSVSLGLALSRGNSDTVLATGAFKTHQKGPNNELLGGLDGSYGESDHVKNNETVHGTAQYNHLFSERCYGYLNVEGLHDEIADLQYRLTTGPGAGYYLLHEPGTSLAGEVGPSVINERLGSRDRSYASGRLAERFERKLSVTARLWQKAEILPQLDGMQNYLVNTEIGLEASLTKTLCLRVILQDNFVNQPAPGRQGNDIKTVSGLVLKF